MEKPIQKSDPEYTIIYVQPMLEGLVMKNALHDVLNPGSLPLWKMKKLIFRNTKCIERDHRQRFRQAGQIDCMFDLMQFQSSCWKQSKTDKHICLWRTFIFFFIYHYFLLISLLYVINPACNYILQRTFEHTFQTLIGNLHL